jgi:hypothetical protein
MGEPQSVIYKLMEKDPNIIAAAVLKGKKDIIFQTDNWDIRPDIDRVISSWIGMNAAFINISGVKYSMLQCTAERMAATSVKGEGSIVAAKDDEHKIIAYVSPDGDMRGAMMDTARALDEMSSREAYIDEDTQLGNQTSFTPHSETAGIDGQLKGEIQAFLKWVKDSEGFQGYVRYYLQQNNTQIISELSKIYSDLRNIFGV